MPASYVPGFVRQACKSEGMPICTRCSGKHGTRVACCLPKQSRTHPVAIVCCWHLLAFLCWRGLMSLLPAGTKMVRDSKRAVSEACRHRIWCGAVLLGFLKYETTHFTHFNEKVQVTLASLEAFTYSLTYSLHSLMLEEVAAA